MPLFKTIQTTDYQIFIWKFDEADGFDFSKNPQNFPQKKLAEKLMVKKLVSLKYPQGKLLHKPCGEPFLENEKAEISITHSFPFAAVAFSHKKIGIDLEKINERIIKLKDKFVNKWDFFCENDNFEKEYLTAIWTIKESLYKLHGSKLFSFRENYFVEPFDFQNITKIKCGVCGEYFHEVFFAEIFKIEDYLLAAAV